MSQRKSNKNKVKNYLILAAVIIGVGFLSSKLIFGSRFQLAESENPIGYYSVEISNRDRIPVGSLDFDLVICNSTDSTTYYVVNGAIISGSGNSTGLQYAYSQSYAVIVGDSVKSQTIPIECSDYEDEPVVNVIEVILMALTSDISADIRISKINSEYPYISYEAWTASGYAVEANTCYSVSISIEYSFTAFDDYDHYIGTKPCTVGDFNILPDSILESYDKYDITEMLGVTNYEGHFFMVNSSIQNISSAFPGVLDPTQFTYELGDYTSIKFDSMVCSLVGNEAKAVFNFEFQFNSTSDCTLSYCLFDGALDAAFDDMYAYYKIGGF
jgi:hypothetical protein